MNAAAHIIRHLIEAIAFHSLSRLGTSSRIQDTELKWLLSF